MGRMRLRSNYTFAEVIAAQRKPFLWKRGHEVDRQESHVRR
jgi:hypothetical protein